MVVALGQLIAQYGYLAVAVGCLFEGETSILLGIIASHHTSLVVEGVVVSAIIGTIIGDNTCFHVGRRMGRPALDKRPGWQAKAARVERLLERYGAPIMIGFRFLYGVRYVTPFVLGSLDISPWRFLLLDGIGTLLWANTIAVIGIYLADALQRALAHIHSVEMALLVIVATLVIAGLGIYYLHRRRDR